jgi:hypothetical protein
MLTTSQSLQGTQMPTSAVSTERKDLVDKVIKREPADEPLKQDLSDRWLLPLYRKHKDPCVGYILLYCGPPPKGLDWVVDKLYFFPSERKGDLNESIEDALQDVFASSAAKVLFSTQTMLAFPDYPVDRLFPPAHWEFVYENRQSYRQHKSFLTPGQPGPSRGGPK